MWSSLSLLFPSAGLRAGRYAVLFSGVLLVASCSESGGNESEQLLLAGLALSVEPAADVVPETGFPGSSVTVNDESFSGSTGDYTVTINGTAATVTGLSGGVSLTFTMPSLSFEENTTVPMVIEKNGTTVLQKTIRFRPALTITANQPNSLQRKVSSNDNRSFFQITITGSADFLFNVFGGGGDNLDLYYHTSPTSGATPLAIAESGGTDFKKINLSPGTYYIEVRRFGGPFNTFFYLNVANGPMAPVTTANLFEGSRLCYDYGGAGEANPGPGCDNVNDNANFRTGLCTYPTANGIHTRSFYIKEGFGFDPCRARDGCLDSTSPGFDSPNPSEALFQTDYASFIASNCPG